jgi:hypothetical protein
MNDHEIETLVQVQFDAILDECLRMDLDKLAFMPEPTLDASPHERVRYHISGIAWRMRLDEIRYGKK